MPESYLAFWVGGLALAAVPMLHWFTLGRALAVSGRFSALIDRVRFGAPQPELDQDALLAAIRAATEQTFGADTLESASVDAAPPAPAAPREGPSVHASFLVGLLLGGLASAVLGGTFAATPALAGKIWLETFGSGAMGYTALFAGGTLVGFGTRMAGGCTSGHGLCGLSQRQAGSLAATCSFFGAGIVTSLLLGAM